MKYLIVNQSKLLIIGSSIAFLLIAVISMMAIHAAEDDAFIVYRYVDRFLEHKGLTYNDGESVEGFTSLLWTILLAGGSFIWGVKPYVASVWINYTFILLTALSMIWLLQILRVGNLLQLISVFLYSISILYFKVVFLGLEFGLFTLLLFLFLCFFLRSLDYPNYIAPAKLLSCVSGFLTVALFATRPESIIVLPVLSLVAYIFQRQNRNIKPSLVYFACSFVLFLTLILAWRLTYYGELLPNSVIAKLSSLGSMFAKVAPFSREALLRDGIMYLVNAYTANPAFLFTIFVVGIVIWKKWRTFEFLLLFTPILWQHVIIIENGGDWMDYSRFITMFAPLFIVGFSLALEVILSQHKTVGIVSLFVFSSLYLFANVPYLTLAEKSPVGFSLDETDSYQKLGQALNDVWMDDDILISEAIGRIAYFMPKAIARDPAGLTDKTLARDQTARRSVFGRQNWYYSLSLKPAVIVLQHWPHQITWSTFDFGYPEQFVFYCLPPLADVGEEQWLYIIIPVDKDVRYGPPLVKLGARKLAYEDFQADYRICRPND